MVVSLPSDLIEGTYFLQCEIAASRYALATSSPNSGINRFQFEPSERSPLPSISHNNQYWSLLKSPVLSPGGFLITSGVALKRLIHAIRLRLRSSFSFSRSSRCCASCSSLSIVFWDLCGFKNVSRYSLTSARSSVTHLSLRNKPSGLSAKL